MKRIPPSIWLTTLMAIYAVGFFIYEFMVRQVGFTLRNTAVAVLTVLLIVIVWGVNRSYERKHSGSSRHSVKKQGERHALSSQDNKKNQL